MNWIKKTIKILSINAVIFSLSILAFYFHATKILGYYPSYNNPDPKQLDIYESYSLIVNFTFGLWFFSFLLWTVLLIIFMIKTRKELHHKFMITTIFFNCVPIIIVFSDIFKWYID